MVEKILSSHYIYCGNLVKLRKVTVELPSGKTAPRELVEHNPCVVVVALDTDGKLLMVKQYRLAAAQDMLELVAGSMDSGETPEESTRRELREEAGYKPNTLRRLGGFYSSPGFLTEYLYVLVATDLEYAPLTAEDTEDIEVFRYTPAEVKAMIANQQITDSKTLAGLMLYFSQTPG
ncbi:DNA mismatch repair protein MutT [Dehalococcoides mccartyi]|uniref:NUDIX hydrolase n=1 Tax=Dehalococcoides mccartyi TaxID=61435 RepID=UPI00006ADE37|nr:NUDIX hydrolase [Dehalococcoides mccartyi]AGG07527.1 NUDIX hydrolase domain-containing protein [Dehalococcoides mccartyi BTF08]KSV16730.1 DNA mismatch repair protein MutT [Dehalococcoides mccartyi]OBW63066.1 MAG: DNA mismatch repair protein MutT [Dehalococcoides mccartyi]BAS31505.1 NUDIX hydrolase [Dehalococcoides mccartyi IBARAKI]BEL00493.1 NUDIX hydrolase [Dehalococcoides mccartyi]